MAAKNSGADVAKFQLFKTKSLVSRNAKKAPYQLNSKKINKNNLNFKTFRIISIKDFSKLKVFVKKKLNLWYLFLMRQALKLLKN